jgi:ParB family chromosome partitioning protein
MKPKTIDLGLTGYDELFMTDEGRAENRKPKVDDIPISELTEFPGHPFKVTEGEEMTHMIESIHQFGVLVPAIVRPTKGGYEMISGHRRLAACRALGIDTMPVIVREMSNDEAVITMVDANLQREHILPSEKAFAYKMKMDAMKHQGKLTSRQVVGKLETADEIGVDESGRQVQRYIRLTNLIPELLQLVDDGKIAFNPAVEISYLREDEQQSLLDAMEQYDCTPSHAQAIQLKKLSQDGLLTADELNRMLSEPKPNQQEHLRFKKDEFKAFFPPSYTETEMKQDILRGLELLKRQRERNRDAR